MVPRKAHINPECHLRLGGGEFLRLFVCYNAIPGLLEVEKGNRI